MSVRPQRPSRIHVDAPLAVGARLALPDNAAAHLLRVLRLGIGDACALFNGDGHDYAATIVSVARKSADIQITAVSPVDCESPLRITLVQALARGEKMDWIIQKTTELGVAAIQPIISERTEVKLDGERADKRRAHWRGVAIAACEQCGRTRLPVIAEPLPLHRYVSNADPGALKLVLDPLAMSTPRSLALDATRTIDVVIGPEGGWSERDRKQLEAVGFQGVRLGPRVLRTETAGLAMIAALQAMAGDLG
jgi:16S rRNA (uracil1498-N3)-methyltransferase